MNGTDMNTFREAAITLVPSGDSATQLSGYRKKGKATFEALGFPTRKHEAWRYINLESILESAFVLPEAGTPPPHIDASAIERYILPETWARWVTINEHFTEKLSTTPLLPEGVIVTDLKSGLTHYSELVEGIAFSSLETEVNPFAALNAAHVRHGIFIHVPADVSLPGAVELLLITTDIIEKPALFSPRIVVNVESGAKLDLMITHLSLASRRTFENGAIDLNVGENATCNVTWLQRGSSESIAFVTTSANAAKGSSLHFTTFSHGGKIARNEIRVDLNDEEASCHVNGLGLLTEESQVFSHIITNHRQEKTTSRQLYKNILNGSARSEFNSLSHIFKGAVNSDSGQLNRNIVLSKKARAIVRPQLKVYNEDVTAAHGATIGQISPEELFYLRSRGIPKEEAQSLLIYGFAEEVVETIPSPQVRAHVESFVRGDLGNIVGDRSR